jgi:hypothetical protein
VCYCVFVIFQTFTAGWIINASIQVANFAPLCCHIAEPCPCQQKHYEQMIKPRIVLKGKSQCLGSKVEKLPHKNWMFEPLGTRDWMFCQETYSLLIEPGLQRGVVLER